MNTKKGPSGQLFLQTYEGGHGRPADTVPGGHPNDAAKSHILFVLCIRKTLQREAAESRILVLLGIQNAPENRPPTPESYCCLASRGHPNGGPRIADSIAVRHPERRNSQNAGRSPPTDAKMRSPTPCQEHYQTNTKRGPPEQLFLQTYKGDHGRPADRAPAG